MNIDIHIIINMNNNFGVGDHFQVLRVSEGVGVGDHFQVLRVSEGTYYTVLRAVRYVPIGNQ